MAERGLSKNAIIAELTKSPHGDLKQFVPTGQAAARQEGEFLAHLIGWNRLKGQVRDSQVALPVISLSVPEFEAEFVENSLAHIALLKPREFLRAYRFTRELGGTGRRMAVRRLAVQYLRNIERKPYWEKVALQHRHTLRELYALTHTKPGSLQDTILFGPRTSRKWLGKIEKMLRPAISLFSVVRSLRDMQPKEAAGVILERKIPFLIAQGALGAKIKEPDLVLALIDRMSATELVNNSKMLARLGVKTVPALRAAYEEALKKAGGSKKATFKATRAAEALEDEGDEGIKAKLQALQEKQIAALGGVEGDWLILADKSGSMSGAIEAGRQIAATLARMANGQTTLVFFDVGPRLLDVTGKTYDEILDLTKHVNASGGTSIGCGLLAAIDKGVGIDGIVIVSDGGENATPRFPDQYKALVALTGKQVPVYLYLLSGEPNSLGFAMSAAGLDMQEFDLRGGVDFYSLPNLTATMKTRRYDLVQEILGIPLLTLDEVFNAKRKEVANVV